MNNESLVNEMMQSIAQSYNESYTKLFPLKSLWISEHRRKYIVGDKVIVKDGKLVNSQGIQCTHEITLLEGTLSDNKHCITVKDLSNNEVKTIEL